MVAFMNAACPHVQFLLLKRGELSLSMQQCLFFSPFSSPFSSPSLCYQSTTPTCLDTCTNRPLSYLFNIIPQTYYFFLSLQSIDSIHTSIRIQQVPEPLTPYPSSLSPSPFTTITLHSIKDPLNISLYSQKSKTGPFFCIFSLPHFPLPSTLCV